MAAEALYLALSEVEDEIDPDFEDLLLGTAWTDEGVGETEGQQVLEFLRTI